ncbi:MAG: polyhydroxyalkanoate synthesis repressor PhaR [Pseudomonadota bacterium]
MTTTNSTRSGAAGDTPIVIKKYANRRLYNTSKSSYVTLDHLAEMVREGQDFVVRDAKSGDDITRSVLTQIIFEEEGKGASMLPTNFLRQIISLYGDSLQSVVPGYLEASMETFARHQEEMRTQVTRMFGAAPAIENLEALTRKNMEWFDQAMRMFSPFAVKGGAPSKDASGEAGEDKADHAGRSEELDQLKDQLAIMQAQLNKLSRKD